jgi:tRNA A-37 threonylcarbamoyl transferase component Bud32
MESRGPLAERVYFGLCLTLGRLLRGGRYSKVRMVDQGGELQVRKHRVFYAPLLIRMGDPLVDILDTGMEVLPQRAWEDRERQIYQSLYGSSIQIDGDGTLVLPCLPGETLATLLEDPKLTRSERTRAIELAVVALVQFHRLGLTHGDAMAENVLVDLEAGVAHWFDFETMHDPGREMAWRRADDVRALLATCLLRTAPEEQASNLDLILDVYRDAVDEQGRRTMVAEEITEFVVESFASVWRRPLTFHLGQAGLSLQQYRRISRLLGERLGE